jgi:hypothetical protein
MEISPVFFWVQVILLISAIALLIAAGVALVLKPTYMSDSTTLFHHEMRRSRRAPYNAVLEIEHGLGYTRAPLARLRNMSARGACFTSTMPLRQGEWIQGQLRSPKARSIKVTGLIVWKKIQPDGILYGVHFDKTVPI